MVKFGAQIENGGREIKRDRGEPLKARLKLPIPDLLYNTRPGASNGEFLLRWQQDILDAASICPSKTQCPTSFLRNWLRSLQHGLHT